MPRQKTRNKSLNIAEVILDPKTLFGRGKVRDSRTLEILTSAGAMQDEVVGRIIQKHVAGMTPDQKAACLDHLFQTPPTVEVGSTFKELVCRRLLKAGTKAK